MLAMIYITLSCMLLQVTHSLRIRSDGNRSGKSKGFRRVLENLAGSKMLANEQEPELVSMYNILAKQLEEHEKKSHKKRHLLRSMVTVTPIKVVHVDTEHAQLVEEELKNTNGKHTSMLVEPAYVQKSGQNDFLVLPSGTPDPFVTIIPNDIYYQPGNKICVNWLDECSVQGIRARLLHRVRSP